MFRNMSSDLASQSGERASAERADGDGAEAERISLTDPKVMRALAHPLRMALLELLSVNQTLTATQASELLGESPANCAFHLRTLGKYGFAQEAGGGRGRERPWRRVHKTITVPAKQDDPEASVLAESLSRAWQEHWFERARRALNESHALSPEWRDASGGSQSMCYLTAREMTEIGEQVDALIRPYCDRRDPASRPEGALPAELLFISYPLTGMFAGEPEDSPSPQDPDQDEDQDEQGQQAD
jgi:hypothetical protein